MKAALLFLFFLALPTVSLAQEFAVSFGDDGALSSTAIRLFGVITILSIVPGIAMMITCFPFMVTVLSILRQGIGLQSAPPNMVIISLALFLTYFVMEPVFTDAWINGIEPLTAGSKDIPEGVSAALAPFRTFMFARVDTNTLQSFIELRNVNEPASEAPFSILIPSFLLSEITRAFQIGFLVFLPFLIIDLIVSAVLMSMGMMMVPPAIVSLPFKLAFFVVADGWTLISTSLVNGYL